MLRQDLLFILRNVEVVSPVSSLDDDVAEGEDNPADLVHSINHVLGLLIHQQVGNLWKARNNSELYRFYRCPSVIVTYKYLNTRLGIL